MHKILLTLAILISARSLHGMDSTPLCELRRTGKEVKNLSPMTLSQLYYHFSHDLGLLPEIIQQIFSLQCGDVDHTKVLDELKKYSNNPDHFVNYLETLIISCGELLASELCECFFVREKVSICDIQGEYKRTCLHRSKNPKITQILIKIAGEKAWELLTMQTDYGSTALQVAAYNNRTEIVELLLKAAGTNAQDLIIIQDKLGKTVLENAYVEPKIKEVMQKYMTNNTQICSIQ